MTGGSVGKDGATCLLAGAVRILLKGVCELKGPVVERTERERHFGVILEQLKNAEKEMCELKVVLVRRSAQELARERLGTGGCSRRRRRAWILGGDGWKRKEKQVL